MFISYIVMEGLLMFGKLKEKLLKTASKITEKIYNKGEAEEIKEEKKEKPKISLTNLFKRESKKEEIKKEKIEPEIKKTEIVKTEIPKKVEEAKEKVKEIKEETEKKKISFFDRFGLTRAIKKVLRKEVVILEEDIEDVLEELEIELSEADVALEVVEKLIENIKNELVGRKISPDDDVEEITINAVKNAIKNILSQEKIDIEEIIKKNKAQGKPTVIVFVGINGTGKTTTIAKLAYKLKQKGYSVVLAAGDTFRAGAIEQLEQHAKNVGVKVIKHKQGADSAAVIYDAIQHADHINGVTLRPDDVPFDQLFDETIVMDANGYVSHGTMLETFVEYSSNPEKTIARILENSPSPEITQRIINLPKIIDLLGK